MLFQIKENRQLLVMSLEDNISTVNTNMFYLFSAKKLQIIISSKQGGKCHSVAFKETRGKIQEKIFIF